MLAKLQRRSLVVLMECPSCVAPFRELLTRKPASPIHAFPAFPIVSDIGYYPFRTEGAQLMLFLWGMLQFSDHYATYTSLKVAHQ
jgi:hypothetical protein